MLHQLAGLCFWNCGSLNIKENLAHKWAKCYCFTAWASHLFGCCTGIYRECSCKQLKNNVDRTCLSAKTWKNLFCTVLSMCMNYMTEQKYYVVQLMCDILLLFCSVTCQCRTKWSVWPMKSVLLKHNQMRKRFVQITVPALGLHRLKIAHCWCQTHCDLKME